MALPRYEICHPFTPRVNTMCTVSSVSFGKSSLASKPVEVCPWTDVKVKQAWLYSLSAIATVGAVAMSSVALVGAAIPLAAVAVASLPGLLAGSRAFVNDSSVGAAGNFGAIVAGGAANFVPVWCDGTNWRIG